MKITSLAQQIFGISWKASIWVTVALSEGQAFGPKEKFKDVLAINSTLKPMTYPYLRDSIGKQELVSRIPLLFKGEAYTTVLEEFGRPNAINLTYKGYPVFMWTKPVGFSFVYLFSENQPNGSAIERNTKVIRLHFDTDKKLKRVLIDTLDIRENIEATKVYEDSLIRARVKR